MTVTRAELTTHKPINPTYEVQAPVVGPSGGGPSGNNKAMVSILNPSGSGKVAKIRVLFIQPESTSGTNVIVLFELRRITAHSGGTVFTPLKMDSADANSVLEAKTAPASVTGSTNIHSFILQANTVQGVYMHTFGDWGEKPIVLREGEGLVVHQVTGNGGTFHIQLKWTEED